MTWKNTLYYGDNLSILREYLPNESVDVIYLDPPFNSNRSYNVLFKDESGEDSQAQITAFEDTWHWDASAEAIYHEIVETAAPHIVTMIGAFREVLGSNQIMGYLVMMTAQLIELHRVLKPTGSLYLHCDPTASHYLKIVLDTIFRAENFRNEIVWKRTSGRKSVSQYGRIHDILFFYSKSSQSIWNAPKIQQAREAIRGHDIIKEGNQMYRLSDLSGAGDGPSRRFGEKEIAPPSGRHWMYDQAGIDQLMSEGRIVFNRNGVPRLKKIFDDAIQIDINDIWSDIDPVNSAAAERMGYPTQKPVALLERIIQSCSNEGDLVLDPFCGCGTTIHAAHKLNRRWIGIDLTHLAIALQKYRLKDAFGLVEKQDYQVVGEPEDLAAARQLAQDDRYQFQWWALSLIQAQPVGGDTGSKEGKKGADKGIDGVISFLDDPKRKPKKLIVQVKSGKVKSGDIRDLIGVIDSENAAMGVFLTLESPTKDMQKAALAAGYYHSPNWNKDYPKVQILTIEDLFAGATVQMPPTARTHKKAQKETTLQNGQHELL